MSIKPYINEDDLIEINKKTKSYILDNNLIDKTLTSKIDNNIIADLSSGYEIKKLKKELNERKLRRLSNLKIFFLAIIEKNE